MAYFLYNLCLLTALLLALPLLPLALFIPKVRRGLGQRMGLLPPAVRASAAMAQRRIWVHAASVGEVNAVSATVKELLRLLPQAGVVVTCTTAAGVDQARRRIPDAFAHLLMPLDLGIFLNPVVGWFQPGLALLVETELWPKFVRSLSRHGCVVMVVNARMSERSLRRYRLARGLFSEA
jgi:3-deoxy-D-manno-octulosonic-acid transferase